MFEALVDGRDLPAEDVHIHLPLGGVVGPHLGLEAVPHDVVPATGILTKVSFVLLRLPDLLETILN